MRTVETIAALREALHPHRSAGETIGLVPTMGAFHDGHLALMRAAREECDVVVVSLFVNPTQFAEQDDLARYPRDPEEDRALAEEAGVDVLFAPGVEEMYPEGFQTWVEVEEVSHGMEGDARPGHFRGVATICRSSSASFRPCATPTASRSAPAIAVSARRSVASRWCCPTRWPRGRRPMSRVVMRKQPPAPRSPTRTRTESRSTT